jgi:hypothetical protein
MSKTQTADAPFALVIVDDEVPARVVARRENQFAAKVAQLAANVNAEGRSVSAGGFNCPTEMVGRLKGQLSRAGHVLGVTVNREVTVVDGNTSHVRFWIVPRVRRPKKPTV